MKEKIRKRKKVIITILVVCALIAAAGITYAFITQVFTGEKQVVINAGVLDLVLEEENAITISDALPMYDEVGMIQEDVFEFRLVNKTSNPTNYVLKLQEIETGTLDKSIVKYGLIKEGEKTIDFVSNIVDEVIDEGTINENDTIDYELRLWIDSEVTNLAQVESKFLSFRISTSVSQEIEEIEKYKDNSGANVPVLTNGMIPVTYNEKDKTWVKADIFKEWYDYETQMWANAVTVTETTRDTYTALAAGEPISMNDINTMWVWIPRYGYQYTDLGTSYAGGTQTEPGEIKVNFISSNTITPSDSNIYKIPEGFKFGEENISGFWMAKFETTGTITTACASELCNTINLSVKPNETAVVNQTVSSFFYASRSMQNSFNASKYGFDLINEGTMDVHTTKNTEWGIVAMLSQSKYGKYGNSNYEGANKEIYRNTSENYITGSSSGLPSSTTTISTQIPYNTPNTGYGASTTGTIYGVYDMSGGAYDYVMATNLQKLGSGFSSFPNNKYYDTYLSSINATTYKTGDATYETQNWYSDYYYSNVMWMTRGGGNSSGVNTGVFSVACNDGYLYPYITFRLAIKP